MICILNPDVEINIKGDHLIITGKSYTKKEHSGFRVNSTHIWSKNYILAHGIKKETIKIAMGSDNFLRITAENSKMRK